MTLGSSRTDVAILDLERLAPHIIQGFHAFFPGTEVQGQHLPHGEIRGNEQVHGLSLVDVALPDGCRIDNPVLIQGVGALVQPERLRRKVRSNTRNNHAFLLFEEISAHDGIIYFPLITLCFLVLFTAITISPIYNFFVYPEITSLLGKASELKVIMGTVTSSVGSFNDTIVFISLIVVIIMVTFVSKLTSNSVKIKDIYLCGENNSEENRTLFRNGLGDYEKSVVSNFYFEKIFNEKTFSSLGSLLSISLIIIALLGGLL